jgi:hypothetical protein
VQICRGEFEWTTKALIDTGSPHTVFDRAAADAVGVDFNHKKPVRRRHQLAGAERWAQTENVEMHLVNTPFDNIWWNAEVDFLLDDWEMPFGLLGQEGFLDKWVVTFYRYRNYFLIQTMSDYEEAMPVDVFEEFQKGFDGWDRPD